MAGDWTDAMVAEQMELDQEFGDRIDAASLDRQQWSLVMTAVEFEVGNAIDPENATLRPDTTNVPAVLPELEKAAQRGPPGMGGRDEASGGSSGLFDAVTGALGLGGDDEDDRMEEIEKLTDQYCTLLQEKLEEKGRWAEVCRQARQAEA